MYPVYKDMTSHPYQRNDIPSTQCYHPGWGLAVPSQMKEDPSSSTGTHESWPHNYGYPVPMQCRNCCTHCQHPGYYNFRPPCSHFPPPPPPPPYHHFYGGYPPYPQPYTMYYGPPPPYSMELPRYEYDKSVPRDQFHCCGSLNHPHHVKGGSNVKIEEHEPDAEKKKSESSSPCRVNNFPYPIMWIPPEYTNTMNKEQPRRLVENEGDQQHGLPYVKKPQVQQIPIEKESQENEGTTLDRKPNQNVQSAEQDPNVDYGWFPLDINRLKQLMEGGDAKQPRDQVNRSKDEKKAPDVRKKDVNTQPSFPLFWMPYDGREKGSSKDQAESTADATASDGSYVHHRKNELADNKVEKQSTAGGDDSGVGTTGADKKKIVKTIPVKQLDESVPKVSKKEEEHKQETIKNFTSTQSSSTAKKPKLPPICLRIDPPKKKKSNGSSRSPSPPGGKKRQDSDDSSLKRKSEQPREEINIKDAEKTHSHGAEVDKRGSEILKDSAINAEKNVVQQADSYKFNDVKSGDYKAEAQVLQATKESCQESKSEKKVMSEMEAAVAIQTAYRGHNVRRSEPIQKLKQIAKVHEEVIQVKKNLEDLESYAPVDVKEKTAIGETIMNLLLKLDTMQGLHQSIRDVRKSVAKELISLQEKLDSITSQQTVVLAQDSSSAPAVEEPLRDADLVGGSEFINGSTGQPNKDSRMDGDKNKKIAEEENFSSCDPSSSEPLPCQDGVSSYDNKETFDTSLESMESQERSLSDIMESTATSAGDVAPTSLDLKMKDELGVSEIDPATGFQKLIADTSAVDAAAQNNFELCIENQEAKLVSELPQEVGIVVEKDLLIGNKNHEENLLSEMHQDINEESFANMSINEDAAVENDLVTGNESHKSDSLSVLPQDDVEVDEKDVKLTEQPQENADSVSKMEKEPHEDLPPEVNSDDGKMQTEVENSWNLNKDQVDQLLEKQEVKSEDMMVVGNKTHKPLELFSLGNVSCQEAESISSTNIGTTKETSQISNVMDQKVENSVNLNKDQEVDHANEMQEMIKEDTVAVMDGNHEPPEPSCLETVSGQEVESSSSFTNIKPSEETSELCNVVDVSEHESNSDNAKQEHVETLVPELELQQSKDEDVALRRSLEGQSSGAALEMDEQVDKKIIEENEKLREMLDKLLAAGKEQQEVISNLNGKVKDLEKKLGSSKKKKSVKHPRVRISRRLCGKSDSDSLKQRTTGAS